MISHTIEVIAVEDKPLLFVVIKRDDIQIAQLRMSCMSCRSIDRAEITKEQSIKRPMPDKFKCLLYSKKVPLNHICQSFRPCREYGKQSVRNGLCTLKMINDKPHALYIENRAIIYDNEIRIDQSAIVLLDLFYVHA